MEATHTQRERDDRNGTLDRGHNTQHGVFVGKVR
jgi:hypothetical protein